MKKPAEIIDIKSVYAGRERTSCSSGELGDVIEMPDAIVRRIEDMLKNNVIRQLTRETNVSEPTARKLADILKYANVYKECVAGRLSNETRKRIRELSGIFIDYCSRTYWKD